MTPTLLATIWFLVSVYLLVRAIRRLARRRRFRALLLGTKQNGILLIAANSKVRQAKIGVLIGVLAVAVTIVYVVLDPSEVRGGITGTIVIAILAAYTWSSDQDDRDGDRQLAYADPPDQPRRRRGDNVEEEVEDA